MSGSDSLRGIVINSEEELCTRTFTAKDFFIELFLASRQSFVRQHVSIIELSTWESCFEPATRAPTEHLASCREYQESIINSPVMRLCDVDKTVHDALQHQTALRPYYPEVEVKDACCVGQCRPNMHACEPAMTIVVTPNKVAT